MLRDYQQKAVDSVYDFMRTRPNENPCVVLPTGSGKTHVIKQIVSDAVDKWGGRVCVLAHVKELLEQAAEKLSRPDVGIYSAGLKCRELDKPITVAGIQSVYNKAHQFEPFNLILVDEAHLIPPSGDGMYQQFLQTARKMNPRVRLVGLTATPYRMTVGSICGKDRLLNEVCYSVGVRELIDQGYLCKLRSKGGRLNVNLAGVKKRGGEFVASDLEAAMDDDQIVDAAVEEIKLHTRDRNSVLIFASGVRHAMHLYTLIEGSEMVLGDTPMTQRAKTIERFRSGELKYLINVNVLSTGFDAPNVDAIALLRPTLSPGLYYQQVGRGLRLHESKQDCLVLDFAGNVKRHGPIDDLIPPEDRKPGAAPVKECPQCHEHNPLTAESCSNCGHEFPVHIPEEQEYKAKHNPVSDDTPILAVPAKPENHIVTEVRYAVHYKRGAEIDDPRTLRVDYICGLGTKISEWVCVEHGGFAGKKARNWWSARSHDPFPDNADHAVAIAEAGGLAETQTITTKKEGKYTRVVEHGLGEAPTPTFLIHDDVEDF